MSFKLSIGRAAITAEDMFTNEAIMAFIDKHVLDIDASYLYYLFSGTDWSAGTNRAVLGLTLNKAVLSQKEIEIPPLDAQLSAVRTLDKISGLLALRKRQLVKLDELVKARFVELFGDVVWNNRDWPLYQFSKITTSRLGKMLDAKQQTGNYQYPYLANFNVQWFRFDLDKLNEMDFSKEEQIEFSLRDGDLLVCEGGEIGRCAVWHNETQPCYFQKAIHRVRCNKNYIIPDYLAWWFKYNCDHGGFASIEGAKATISHLPGAKLKVLNVAVPPLDLQERFAAFVEQSDKSKLAIQNSVDKLETLKAACMQAYFG
ncbi:MAG: restriction endonuclease subunit S [Oscillibacter sp.]|nr:restriction endonuclease subunit S [Oscillibacter sp.]